MEKFEMISGLRRSTGHVNFVEMFFTQKNLNLCEPFSKNTVYHPSPNEIITVFYKSNNCPAHPFSISSIIRWKVLSEEEKIHLKQIVWSIVKELYFPPVRKNGKFNNCLDNGTRDNPTGGTRTVGCSESKGFFNRCKWFQIPRKKPGRFRFSIEKSTKAKSDNDLIVYVKDRVADICARETFTLTPIAAENMSKRLAPECSIGKDVTAIFGAMSIVSDYVAHGHLDENDYPLGVTSLLSLQHDERKGAQLHCLNEYSITPSGPPGIAVDLGDGSVLISAASRVIHSSTRIKNPNFRNPSRVGLVCFQHNCLTLPDHGSLR